MSQGDQFFAGKIGGKSRMKKDVDYAEKRKGLGGGWEGGIGNFEKS